MKKIVFMVCLMTTCIGGWAQTKEDFQKLWDKQMSLKDIRENPSKFLEDLGTFFVYKYDSVDYKLSMVGFPMLLGMTNMTSGADGDDKKVYVFRLIDSVYSELLKEEGFMIMRTNMIVMETLNDRTVDIRNWKKDREILKKTKIGDEELEKIRKLVKQKTGKGVKYGEFLNDYFAKMEKEREKDELQNRR